MTSKKDIAKSLKMPFFEQNFIISQFEDDQSLRRRLIWAFLNGIEEKDREGQEKVESDSVCSFSY